MRYLHQIGGRRKLAGIPERNRDLGCDDILNGRDKENECAYCAMDDIFFHALFVPVMINRVLPHDKNKSENNERLNYGFFKF
jgi:hypothetical protein